MRADHPRRDPCLYLWPLLALGWLLGLAGYFGPWVPHKAAGLVILGLDLAEYVKLLPEVASGQLSLRREIFYLPLVSTSVSAALLASRRQPPLPLRVLLMIAAIPTALAMLPPAWSLATLRQAEFRLQVLAILICLSLLPGIFLTRHLPSCLVFALIGLLAFAAALIPAWGFLQVRPLIAQLYRDTLALGWGFWLCTAGNLLMAGVAAANVLSIAWPRTRGA